MFIGSGLTEFPRGNSDVRGGSENSREGCSIRGLSWRLLVHVTSFYNSCDALPASLQLSNVQVQFTQHLTVGTNLAISDIISLRFLYDFRATTQDFEAYSPTSF